ncbi:relaxase/mobilization nuclease domain-containing protein [Peristeroidobacter soli]|uniref:relaxase/mobilization nuclease domain-containing protein n=1 Tax=Peristeroidobacter soli TaxID=2497877 RepID=UPI00101DC636|nr:relaxase/mobilization nuclease domain-containing protein [Peristeroidobacter soli]
MIKVTGGGRTVGAVWRHLRYIDRRGELELETDDGERLRLKGAEKALLEDWGLALQEREDKAVYTGLPGRKPAKLVHNLMFSMPKGTPPHKLLAAVRHFAQETFALQHRYAMVLHTDQDHPHVHLVLKAVSELGTRLNIRKDTLRQWRRDFAGALRAQGVAANATERAVRGVSRTHQKDGIYRAMRRGQSTRFEERVQSVAGELRSGRVDSGDGKEKLLATRRDVERGWYSVSALLSRDGDLDLASQVRQFTKEMQPAYVDREWIAAEFMRRLRAPTLQQPRAR